MGSFSALDLTEIQCDMSDVNQQYEGLGAALRGRLEQLSAMLDKMREAQDEVNSVLSWLEEKEQALKVLEASSSPTKSETMRAQAEHNKVLFSCINKILFLAFLKPSIIILFSKAYGKCLLLL